MLVEPAGFVRSPRHSRNYYGVPRTGRRRINPGCRKDPRCRNPVMYFRSSTKVLSKQPYIANA